MQVFEQTVFLGLFTTSTKILPKKIITDSIISLSVDVECELSEVEAYLRAMDVEFRAMPSADKKAISVKVIILRKILSNIFFNNHSSHAYIIKINAYIEEVKQLNQSYNRSKNEAEALALKSGSTSRAKLIAANQKLDQSTLTLEQSRQIIAQTDHLGNTIISDMENQKETLVGAQAKVDETRGFTSNAKAVLVSMGNRAIRHTCCVATVILLLLGLNGVTIYFAFIDKNKQK